MVSPVRIRVPPLKGHLQIDTSPNGSGYTAGPFYCNRGLAEGFVHSSPCGVSHSPYTVSRAALRALANTHPQRSEMLRDRLSLRFNQEGFCDGLYSIAKPLAFAQFIASGSRFDGRVALGPAREPTFGSPGRPTAGFRRLRRRAHLRQKR